jgi:hypothetical protein
MSVVAAQPLPSIAPFDSVFPLPLTILESFLVMDSRPDYPMHAEVEVELQGRLDPAAFQQALSFALARNPLLTCLVDRKERGAIAWVPSGQCPPVYWVGLEAPLGDSYGKLFDLTTEPGLRIWVRQADDRLKILLQFHHACSDGLGCFGFIEDLLAAYAAAVSGGQPVEPRPLEPDRLLHRGEIGIVGRTFWQQVRDAIIGMFEGERFLLQRPMPLAAGASTANAELLGGGPGIINGPGFLIATCSEQVTAGLRRAAEQAGGTTNDVMMRDLFLTLRRWNTDRDGATRRRRLRILMPQNLRGPDDGRMPAANVMSFAFVTRRAKLCDSPQKLLHSIRVETEAVKRGLLSLYFIGGLFSLQSLGILPWLLKRRLCFATAVLSNLGYPTRRFLARFPRSDQGLVAGNLVVTGITASPPLRPHTHAAFGVMSSDRQITISLRCDQRTCSPDDAQCLLNAYLAQLTATADGFDRALDSRQEPRTV